MPLELILDPDLEEGPIKWSTVLVYQLPNGRGQAIYDPGKKEFHLASDEGIGHWAWAAGRLGVTPMRWQGGAHRLLQIFPPLYARSFSDTVWIDLSFEMEWRWREHEGLVPNDSRLHYMLNCWCFDPYDPYGRVNPILELAEAVKQQWDGSKWNPVEGSWMMPIYYNLDGRAYKRYIWQKFRPGLPLENKWTVTRWSLQADIANLVYDLEETHHISLDLDRYRIMTIDVGIEAHKAFGRMDLKRASLVCNQCPSSS